MVLLSGLGAGVVYSLSAHLPALYAFALRKLRHQQHQQREQPLLLCFEIQSLARAVERMSV